MSDSVAKFFELQRHIFGICPQCNNFFRLSDSKIFLKKKPVLDWMDEIDLESQKLETREQEIAEKKKELQREASAKGRRLAQLEVNKIDRVFTPRKLDPDDAKVLLNPIDYVVFNGMNTADSIKNIVLLDRQTKQPAHRKIQNSIEHAIDRENYEWQTLRVEKDGKIKVE
jgi:predicted Holliday junction resolvase-like endonuclease